MYPDTTNEEINAALEKAWRAFHHYRKCSLKQRANFMRAIAANLDSADDVLIQTAMRETNLPEARLKGEKARTVFQLTSYADACEKGEWLEARIDTAIPDKTPPKPDLRKMLVPLGPVVVFGSSNFPFAYSTAGGDTACAFAAGCPVVVKAHPAHAETSTMVAALITKAAQECSLPEGIFSHVYGAAFEVGEALVKHPYTKAVGFTGSYTGGKQLFDWGAQRKEPIPVFAEMGSINPVFLFPQKLQAAADEVAKMCAASITLGIGQFCTNPGIIVTLENGKDREGTLLFIIALAREIQQAAPGKMLHPGITKGFTERSEKALLQEGVALLAKSLLPVTEGLVSPMVALVLGKNFLNNPVLAEEVFGPYSLVVVCADESEMLSVVKHLPGQLTSTIMATEGELAQQAELVQAIQNICGRLIFNGVPTGVEVCLSMQHGGPFPASSDARFTSVGADGIKRFARPVAYQNWASNLLPDELKNENPLGIYRTVNNELSNGKI